MINNRPILIAGPPRSGTTMLAGVFIYHNCWVGNCKVTSYPETNSLLGTENVKIKKYLKSLYPKYRNWTIPIPDVKEDEKLRGFLSKLVPPDNAWVVKTGALLITWRIWNNVFPEALWVFPERPFKDIVSSALRHPAMRRRGDRRIRKFIKSLQVRQSVIEENVKNSIRVDTHTIGKHRDFTRCKEMVEKAGLQYEETVVDLWVKRKKWHGKG